MQAFHAHFLQKAFVFHVDEKIESSATRVVFNNSDDFMQGICLKMWLECQNELYNTGNLKRRTSFLLEGLRFNRRFSGNVCYGIVPILGGGSDEIECGPLIEKPSRGNLVLNRPYALVMKRLEEQWHLNQLIQSGKFGNIQSMKFLADKVAGMH